MSLHHALAVSGSLGCTWMKDGRRQGSEGAAADEGVEELRLLVVGRWEMVSSQQTRDSRASMKMKFLFSHSLAFSTI